MLPPILPSPIIASCMVVCFGEGSSDVSSMHAQRGEPSTYSIRVRSVDTVYAPLPRRLEIFRTVIDEYRAVGIRMRNRECAVVKTSVRLLCADIRRCDERGKDRSQAE